MAYDARTLVQRWFNEVWNDRRDESIDELMASESVGHVEGGTVDGRDGFRKMRAMFLSAIPDVRIDLEDIIADGDRAAVRWRARGTHSGEGFGFPPTNRPVDFIGSSWFHVRDGQVFEGWDTWNLHGLLGELQGAQADAKKLF